MSTSTKPRIALLVCDTPLPNVLATSGDYTAIFTQLLANSSLAPSGGDFELDGFDVVNKRVYPALPDGVEAPSDCTIDSERPLAAYDILMLSGSKASAYNETADPWITPLVKYMSTVLSKKEGLPKVVGICFGHQIIARALGCTVGVNPKGWEIGPTPIRLTQVGREVFPDLVEAAEQGRTAVGSDAKAGEGGGEAGGIPSSSRKEASEVVMSINQMHRDHVLELPSGTELIAENDISEVQGFVAREGANKTLRLLTLQGHPEFTPSVVGHIAEARAENGVITKELYEDVRRRLENRTDGNAVADVVWRMVRAEV